MLTTAKLVAGSNSVYAAYGGSTDDAAGNSPTVHIAVTAAATSITLKASTTKDNYGASVEFTATVTSAGGKPSGAVTFLANGSSLGSIDVTSGVGSLSSTAPPVGDNSVVAEYAGDADFEAGKSSAVTLAARASPSTTASWPSAPVMNPRA